MSDAESPSAPGPEHQEKHRVSQWLESHGATVYWEERNNWGYPTFRIKRGTYIAQSKPDLVAEIDNIGIAAEFKSYKSKSNVYDSLIQLRGYWFDHTFHEQEYVCDGTPVEITGFVTTTGNSITGHLFRGSDEDILPPEDYGRGRLGAINRGDLPPREWNMTEQHVRCLWRTRKEVLDNHDFNTAPAIGSLLSTALQGDTDPRPAVLWDTENGQNWRVLA